MKNKTIYKIQLITLFSVAIPNIAITCSCEYEPVFCRVVNENHNIVRAVVTNHPDYHLMEIKLIENIHKEITEDTIIVLGQDGVNCGELLGQFRIQDTLILAVIDWEINGIAYWFLGGCGLHYLRYDNGLVIGQITDSLTNQPIQTFRDNLFDCPDLVLPTKEVLEAERISIFPNPVSDILNIRVISNSILEVEIFQLDGQLIRSELNINAESVEFYINNLNSGIYYANIKTPNGILTRKFFKE